MDLDRRTLLMSLPARIEALEGKFKLGQERSEEDKARVLTHLRTGAYAERSLFDVTQAFYRLAPGSPND